VSPAPDGRGFGPRCRVPRPAGEPIEHGRLPGVRLRSLDALHLATVIRIGVDAVVTYDSRMADPARSLGLAVLAPA
jgi:uncharacterized protein